MDAMDLTTDYKLASLNPAEIELLLHLLLFSPLSSKVFKTRKRVYQPQNTITLANHVREEN